MKNNINFSYENFIYFGELKYFFKTSIPKRVEKLHFLDTFTDFNVGEFIFNLENSVNKKYIIPFIGPNLPLNNFFYFLEFVIISKTPSVFHTIYKNFEVILYVEPQNKTDIRFMVFDNSNIVSMYENKEVFNYSYADSSIMEDILINKKEFIKNFYFAYKNIFINYDAIACFEQPFIDYNLWIKESNIISKYLHL